MAETTPAPPARPSLPIRRLTLYKHGIGVVERAGQVAGDEIAITLRPDEVNDALKSLLLSGAQVVGVSYETPRAVRSRLDGSPFAGQPEQNLLDLLRALRGQAVRLLVGDGTEAEEISGRLLGVDLPESEAQGTAALVSLYDETTSTVVNVLLQRVRRVVLLEGRGAEDLRAVLDDSRGDERRRQIVLRLSAGGGRDLTLSYLVPSPTWRISYRLVAAPSSAEMEGGDLVLQGWALFDNTFEEDLDAVEVALIAGQPISFVYDLAASRVPARPVVSDAARVAAGPVEFASALYGEAADEPPAPPAAVPVMHTALSVDAPAFLRRAPKALASRAEMAAQEVAAVGEERGELFEYQVTAPVTVRRGQSALAPIVNASLPYRREILYNERKLPGHPVAALRFENGSGVTLERGPVTVYDESAYRGEGIVPFARDGEEVYVAYAVELGIRGGMRVERSLETTGIGIAEALLHLRQAEVLRTTYRLVSTLAESRAVTVEHAIAQGFALAATRAPDAATDDTYRWRVECQPREVKLFTVEERRVTWQRQRLLDQSYAGLREYLNERWLDDTALARIAPVLDARASIERNEGEAAALTGERDELYRRQEHLRANLAALGTGGDEGALRVRAVARLQAGEDRLDAIEARVAALASENDNLRVTLEAALAGLRAGDLPAEVDK